MSFCEDLMQEDQAQEIFPHFDKPTLGVLGLTIKDTSFLHSAFNGFHWNT